MRIWNRGGAYRLTVVGALSCSSLWACNGQVGGPSGDMSGVSGPGAAGDGSVGPGPGPGQGTAGGGGLAPQPPVVAGGTDPGTKGVHRLNDEEYNNTVRDLLGDPTLDLARGWLPGEAYGFDNVAEVLRINEAQYEKYFDAAVTLADNVIARPDALARIAPCAADANPGCRQSIVENFGLRAWRRPLQPAEVTTMVGVYDAAIALGLDHQGAVHQLLRAFLSSPQFLYRVEFDPDPTSVTPHPVTSYELASRLSYFLWSSTPDDDLLTQAQTAALSDPTALAATVSRMVADPKSERMVRNFSGQWLGIRGVPGHRAFPDLFPSWGADLGESMAAEAYAYFSEFVHSDLPWTQFVSADFNYVDARLAAHYGMEATGAGMQRVVNTADQRVGFLGLGAFLTTSSLPQRTSPTSRARRILADLLCTPPPEPPPAVRDQVDQLLAEAEANPDENAADVQDIRAWLEQHRENPGCATCHAIFDPYGLALENFDAIGQYRTVYPNGNAVVATGELPGGVVLDGLPGVVAAISADPRLTSCVTEKLFIYGLGRGVVETDRPYLDALTQAWVAGGAPTLSQLIQHLVTSAPFLTRHGEAAN